MPNCGGDLTGSWDVVVSSCQDQSYRPPFQISLNDQPVEFAREVPPERTGTDWCSQLVLRSGVIQQARFVPQVVPVVGGMMTYAADGGYQGTVAFGGSFEQPFPRACLEAHGDNPSCAEFDLALNEFLRGSSGFTNISCADMAGGGCNCSYDFGQVAAFTGTWSGAGGVVTHFDSFLLLPNEVDYCVRDDQLQMIGHQRGFIFERFGLRGLVWTRTAVP